MGKQKIAGVVGFFLTLHTISKKEKITINIL